VQAVASTLTTSPLLSELDSDLVKMLVDCGVLVHRADGANVFRQGETGTSLFLILRGEVAVIREGDGVEKELARLRAGAFFGEMAVLTNAPRSATVRAIGTTDLLEISRRDLRAMIDREVRVLKLIMRFFRARMVGTLLSTSALFKLFSRDEKRRLVSSFRLRELGPGYDVLEEGTRAEGLFLVLAGKLEAARGNAVLGALGPGDIFGEMSLLEDTPAMATVRAVARSWVLILPRADFDELATKHPAIRAQLETLAAERKSRNQATLAAQPQPAEQRLIPV
jgi:CRP-like cAMP-binding protein